MSSLFYNVVDVETTGFDPFRNDIVSMCSIILDKDLYEVTRFYETCMPLEMQYLKETNACDAKKIKYIEAISGALEINGYSPKDLSEMQPTRDMLIKYHAHLKKYGGGLNSPIFVQHALIKKGKVGFDWSFVFASHFKADKREYFYKNHREDRTMSTVTISQNMSAVTGLKKHKLNLICEHFDIQLKHHDAESDTQATAELLRRFRGLDPRSIDIWRGQDLS